MLTAVILYTIPRETKSEVTWEIGQMVKTHPDLEVVEVRANGEMVWGSCQVHLAQSSPGKLLVDAARPLDNGVGGA